MAKTPYYGTYLGFSPGYIGRFCWKVVQMCSFACPSTSRDRFRCPISAGLMPKKTALCLGSTNQAQYFGMSLGNTLKEIRLLTMPHLWKMTFMALIWDITAWYAKKVADFWHANGYCDNGGTCNLYKLIELRAVNKCHCQKRGFYFHLRTLWNQLINEISRLHGSVF